MPTMLPKLSMAGRSPLSDVARNEVAVSRAASNLFGARTSCIFALARFIHIEVAEPPL